MNSPKRTLNQINVCKLLEKIKIKPKKILIIGPGKEGRDCQAFNELLNKECEIHAVDIDHKAGKEYQASNVCYIRGNAEQLPYINQYFDLAYSFAVFEHIHDIRSAWQSMINSLRPGGILYTVAAPLWCSPWGHHKQRVFPSHPWIHLTHTNPESLLEYCKANNICSPDSINIRSHIDYIYNDSCFNRRRPSEYQKAAELLEEARVTESTFKQTDIAGRLSIPNTLIELGYSEADLKTGSHTLLAQRV